MVRYDPRVAIRWNESAYSNAGILVNWIEKYLVHALPSGPRLLALDMLQSSLRWVILAAGNRSVPNDQFSQPNGYCYSRVL